MDRLSHDLVQTSLQTATDLLTGFVVGDNTPVISVAVLVSAVLCVVHICCWSAASKLTAVLRSKKLAQLCVT